MKISIKIPSCENLETIIQSKNQPCLGSQQERTTTLKTLSESTVYELQIKNTMNLIALL